MTGSPPSPPTVIGPRSGPNLRTGIGLRAPHISELSTRRPQLGFLEVHTENYFGGGPKLKVLEQLRRDYALSFHGVGLSLGRADDLDADHLRQVAALVERFEPALVSEHLSWSAYGHIHVPDLLPLPFTDAALDVFAAHVDQFQTAIGRRVLIENPSNYLAFAKNTSPETLDYDEPAFLLELVRRTGCALLLDINNIFVSARNLGRDADAYLVALGDGRDVREFHLAGHDVAPSADGASRLIDTHGQPVCDEVWALYRRALGRLGDRPTLIEWDSALPALDVLLTEAAKADAVRDAVRAPELDHAL